MKPLAEVIRASRLEKLYEKYPEVKRWMYCDLRSHFETSESFSVIFKEKKFMSFRWEHSDQLPITDSNGVVDEDDLLEMLRLEGFAAALESEYQIPEMVYLKITLGD
ncbi:hypothetical protein VPHD479_0135 [Vibrio phage D479]